MSSPRVPENEKSSSSEKVVSPAMVISILSLVLSLIALIWNMSINSRQVALQAAQTHFAKIQAVNSDTQRELAQEQALLKKTQDEQNQLLHGIAIHPLLYNIELKIDESGEVLPGQTLEIINGSERIATAIAAYWEIVGSDHGNPEGWGAREEITFDRQTLRPLEQMKVPALPSQLSIIANPNNRSKALEYYGHLRIIFSDSRIKKTSGNSYFMTITHDKAKNVLVMHFSAEEELQWLKVDLEKEYETNVLEQRE